VEARARRAAAAVGLATLVVAAIGVFYLRPWQAFAPGPAALPAPRPPAARPATLQQVQFVSASLGWVVTGGPASSSLFRTTDAGRHWQRQIEGVAGEGWTLSLFDATRGVVYGADQRGAQLWRTTDGGRRWTRTAVPCLAPHDLVSFLDLDHGWCIDPSSAYLPASSDAAAGFGPLLPGRQMIALYRTVDGGVHWSRVLATGEAQPVSGGLGDEGLKAWIWFRDVNVGWIGQRSLDRSAVVYATTDGGDHWNRQELPPPAGGWGSSITWEIGPPEVSGGFSPLLLVEDLRAGSQQGQMVLSAEYLYTWRPSTWMGPLRLPAVPAVPASTGTDQNRWLVATGSSILETTDAGAHWQALGQIPYGWQVSRLTMVDRTHGWAQLFGAVQSGPAPGNNVPVQPATALARTVDGGRHWSLVGTPS
jgi:photosystem II stability/assembly factor-like uncharacterized protein